MMKIADSSAMLSNVFIYATRKELETAAAAEVARVIVDTLSKRSVCRIAMAGGSTPRGVYRIIGMESGKTHIDWKRVHLFFGDERMVPPTDDESNYHMVFSELISHVPIPEGNVHRIRGEELPAVAAALYAGELSALFESSEPAFDLMLLGLGNDGHTASLFPGTEVLEEQQATVSAVFVPLLDAWRTTLTIPVINRSREIIFLVSGQSKAAVIHRLMTAPAPAADLPASLIQPDNGFLRWMIDADAGESLVSASSSAV